MDKKVIVKKLASAHQRESFTRFLPLSKEMVADIRQAVGIWGIWGQSFSC
jgi:hypothetical protein